MMDVAVIAFLDQFENWFSNIAAGLGWPAEGLLRLLVAAVAGGMVGLEREFRGRQAGFRTYLLVALGSAVVMVLSMRLAMKDWSHAGNYIVSVDPGRIAYGVMTGIGFLGAGTILHTKGSVRGLTTAAGIWCVAAVGLAIGMGLYTFGLLGAVLIVAALWLLDYVEDVLPKMRYRTVTVRTAWRPNCIADTVKRFKAAGLRVIDASFERRDNLLEADIHLRICFLSSDSYYSLERELEGDKVYELIATREL
jgi:putative Mg2+ transporter-C (MgtC) family protein